MEALTDKTPWPAPAKINHFLHVTGRREDGYHDLQTLFQFLEWGDTLFFDVTDDGVISRSQAIDGVAEEDDISIIAARLLQKRCNTRPGVSITIDKKLPMGGGLGGGSSNAATTLLALNQLWNAGLSIDELSEIGLSLGADVPVFIHGHSSWAEGVGEKLRPVNLPEKWALVITPDCAVPTKTIFTHPDLPRDTAKITFEHWQKNGGHNDCEAVTRSLFSNVDEAMKWLAQHSVARLSGTGSSIFALFDTREQAQTVANNVPAHWRHRVARCCNESPLIAALPPLKA